MQLFNITKTHPCLYRFFLGCKNKINRKELDIFNILDQNIHVKTASYTPANPSFSYIKVGLKGVYIARTCFPDDLDRSIGIVFL